MGRASIFIPPCCIRSYQTQSLAHSAWYTGLGHVCVLYMHNFHFHDRSLCSKKPAIHITIRWNGPGMLRDLVAKLYDIDREKR